MLLPFPCCLLRGPPLQMLPPTLALWLALILFLPLHHAPSPSAFGAKVWRHEQSESRTSECYSGQNLRKATPPFQEAAVPSSLARISNKCCSATSRNFQARPCSACAHPHTWCPFAQVSKRSVCPAFVCWRKALRTRVFSSSPPFPVEELEEEEVRGLLFF